MNKYIGRLTPRRTALALAAGTLPAMGGYLQANVGDLDDEQIAARIEDVQSKTRTALNNVTQTTVDGRTFTNVLSFGADNTGTTDTRTSVAAAVAALPENGTLYFPAGIYTWSVTDPILVTRFGVTITGPGVIRGAFKMGSGSSRNEMRAAIRGMTFHQQIAEGAYAAGTAFIYIDRVRGLEITDCTFSGVATPVRHLSKVATSSHDNSMTRISRNRFDNCDWAWYVELAEGANWQGTADSDFTQNIVNRSYRGMVWLGGLDGGHIDGNTHFMLNHSSSTNPRFAQKAQNIFVGWSDWLHIHNNNLFECGLESILIENSRTAIISGNNIAWPGQLKPTDAIKVVAPKTGDWGSLTVMNNAIKLYTLSAISAQGNFGEISVGGNLVRYSRATITYKGAGQLENFQHARYDFRKVTSLKAWEIHVTDGLVDKEGHQDLLPGSSHAFTASQGAPWSSQVSAFRSATTTRLTPLPLMELRDVNGSVSTYDGLIQVTVKRANSSNSKSSSYLLFVSKSNGDGNNVTILAKNGYLNGSAPDDPAFNWDIGSNSLRAIPVGSTSGLFFFTLTASGNLALI